MTNRRNFMKLAAIAGGAAFVSGFAGCARALGVKNLLYLAMMNSSLSSYRTATEDTKALTIQMPPIL